MKPSHTLLALAALLPAIVCATAASGATTVWRVDASYNGRVQDPPPTDIITGNYVEPAAAATNAAFGSSGSTDYWNTWDMDARTGVLGGWAWFNGVSTTDGDGAVSTLYSTDSNRTVTIGSTANNGQHQPWYSTGTGSPFQILTSNETSSGINNGSGFSTYSFVISGLTPGKFFLFYSYALRRNPPGGHPPAYYVSLNGGSETEVLHTNYSEGSALSGALLSTEIGESGSVTVKCTYASLTGPGFQFAETDPPGPGPRLTASSVDEDQPRGTTVGSLYMADPGAETWAYTLQGGYGDNASFVINGVSNLQTAVSLDYETKSSYDISVIGTTNGVSYTNQLTVAVNNKPEYLVFQAAGEVQVDTAGPVGTALALADNTPVTYSLIGGRTDVLQIGAASGVVTFKSVPDNTVGDEYYLNIRAVDNGGANTNRLVVKITVVSTSVDSGTIFIFR